jgi:hypothetical protein
MSRSSVSFRNATSRAFERLHPLLGSAPVADRLHPGPMSPEERHARATAVWHAIDAKNGTSERETREKAWRLAAVGRDLAATSGRKACLTLVMSALRYLAAVITRAWGMSAEMAR